MSRPALNQQTFAFTIPGLPGTNTCSNGPVLEIRTLQIMSPFDGRSLIFRTGESVYQCDPYAKFLGSPAEELVAPVSRALCIDGCFSDAVEPGSAVRPDTIAEITINQLYGDIRKPDSPYAVLGMQVRFMDATNGLPGKLILQRYYSRQVAMASTSAAGLIAGWNVALAEILTEATFDLARSKR